jgi:hypothetical protein
MPGISWHVAHAYWLIAFFPRPASGVEGAGTTSMARSAFLERYSSGESPVNSRMKLTIAQMSSSAMRYFQAGMPVILMPSFTTQKTSAGGHSRAV